VCGLRKLTYFNRTREQTIDVPISATPAGVASVGIVVASDDGYIRFYRSDLDKVFWERRVSSGVYASLIVDPVRKWVVVATTNGLIVALDLRGNVQWSVETKTSICATPLLLPDADILVVAGFGARCFGFDMPTGNRVFERTLPPPWHTDYGGKAAHRDPYASPVTTSGSTFVLCCAEQVLAFAADGTELWRSDAGHSVKASPAFLESTGEVAVCTVAGECHFIDRSGDIVGSCDLGAKVTASPAVSGGILAVGVVSEAVIGIDAHRRAPRWEMCHGGPRSYTSITVSPAGDFVYTNCRGNVMCVRSADGHFLWETSQVLGLADHTPDLDITPLVVDDGTMYCGSYTGYLYQFRFQREV